MASACQLSDICQARTNNASVSDSKNPHQRTELGSSVNSAETMPLPSLTKGTPQGIVQEAVQGGSANLHMSYPLCMSQGALLQGRIAQVAAPDGSSEPRSPAPVVGPTSQHHHSICTHRYMKPPLLKGLWKKVSRKQIWSIQLVVCRIKHVFLESGVQNPASEPRVKKYAGTEKMIWMLLENIKGLSPAHSLRFLLILAGIERNPGPSMCDSCGKPVRAAHVKCSSTDCDSTSHKQRKCSGLGRGIHLWLCAAHRPTPVAQPTVAQPTVTQTTVTQPTNCQPTVAQPTDAELAVAQPAVAAQPTVAQTTVAARPTVVQPAVAAQPTAAQPTVAQPTVAQPAVPQPAQCNHCNIPVKFSHLKCAEPACSNVCHKQDTCSGKTRRGQTRDKWKCKEHNPRANVQSTQHSNSPRLQLSNSICYKQGCNGNLKQNPVVCTQCHHGYHQCCSGLNRYSKQRSSWKCQTCLNPTSGTDTTAPESPVLPEGPMPPCLKCKRSVRPKHVTCITCNKACHQSQTCSGLSTRGAQEAAVNGHFWECHTCVKKKSATNNLPSSQADIVEKSEPKPSGVIDHPLRILQWNAEGVNPKLEELRVFLQD